MTGKSIAELECNLTQFTFFIHLFTGFSLQECPNSNSMNSLASSKWREKVSTEAFELAPKYGEDHFCMEVPPGMLIMHITWGMKWLWKHEIDRPCSIAVHQRWWVRSEMGYGNWELEVPWLLLMTLNSYPGVCCWGSIDGDCGLGGIKKVNMIQSCFTSSTLKKACCPWVAVWSFLLHWKEITLPEYLTHLQPSSENSPWQS